VFREEEFFHTPLYFNLSVGIEVFREGKFFHTPIICHFSARF
jgi:hypothetical protein